MNDLTIKWPQRPWILAILLAAVCYAIYYVDALWDTPLSQLWMVKTVSAFIAIAGLSVAFSLERMRKFWTVAFALLWGVVIAAIVYWSSPWLAHSDMDAYAIVSGFIAWFIALPLFQAVHRHGQFKLPYADLHSFSWGNVVALFASLGFVGVSYLLLLLLAALFDLIGINALKQLLKNDGFMPVFIGASFGAALGVLKEHNPILASLQALVMAVLTILAPFLAVGLLLFMLALGFTGLESIWATRAATPIMLSIAVVAIVLANAVIQNGTQAESKNRLLRASALLLSIGILPLAVIAAVSMQLRIEQYGLTPERLWAVVAIGIACAYGLLYVLSVIKGRNNWSEQLRVNNVRMALVLCLLTLFLAFPLLSFNQLSVSSQLARIVDGRTQAKDIDFKAFAFGFGAAGRQALSDMKRHPDPAKQHYMPLRYARWSRIAKMRFCGLRECLIFFRTVHYNYPVCKWLTLADYCRVSPTRCWAMR